MLLGAEAAVLVIIVGGVDGRGRHIHAHLLVSLRRMVAIAKTARGGRSSGRNGGGTIRSIGSAFADGIEAAEEILQCLVGILAGMRLLLLLMVVVVLVVAVTTVSGMRLLAIAAVVVLLLDGVARGHFAISTIVLGHFFMHFTSLLDINTNF